MESLSFLSGLSQSGPRRQAFAAPRQNRRALDSSGPLCTSILQEGKGFSPRTKRSATVVAEITSNLRARDTAKNRKTFIIWL